LHRGHAEITGSLSAGARGRNEGSVMRDIRRDTEERKMIALKTIALLMCSNVFMLFAWYGHLKNLGAKPVYVAILASWSIALLEYVFQVPANRIGAEQFDLGQLKILQEVITLSLFIPFSICYMKQPFRLGYVWAALCMCGAVYFVFKK
jgi:Uncharacterized protein conserved in bacteria